MIGKLLTVFVDSISIRDIGDEYEPNLKRTMARRCQVSTVCPVMRFDIILTCCRSRSQCYILPTLLRGKVRRTRLS